MRKICVCVTTLHQIGKQRQMCQIQFGLPKSEEPTFNLVGISCRKAAMNLFTRNRPTTRPWPLRKHSSAPSPLLYLTLLFPLHFFSYFSLSLPVPSSSTSPKCPSLGGEKFLWYPPLSGFSNQLSEFKNALLMAAILNRTLLVPPVLDHYAVALGSCPKFRVLSPIEIRISVWNHTVEHSEWEETPRCIYIAFGPGSKAESATLLAFGCLFTAPYKGSELYSSIHEAPSDRRIDKIEFLPFTPEIISAGKKFAHDIIKAPFLCAQVRLLDGQFKNHWKATFSKLKQTLDGLTQSPLPIPIFMMIDLPDSNWTGTYLGELVKDSHQFKLFFLKEKDELIIQTGKRIVDASHGLKFGTFLKNHDGTGQVKKGCPPGLPDVLLYIEKNICSCASLGFVGTAGSTIAEIIESMRKFGACSS